jgi:hypothetical protein
MKHDEFEGCGISRFWMLPGKHWAAQACSWHDRQFDLRHEGKQTKPRHVIDRMFLRLLLTTARTRFQRVQAYALYGIAKTFGGLWW